MKIDWQKFYRALDRTKVQIQEPDSADPDQLNDIMRMLAKVNNNRMTLDQTQRKIERLLGACKNDIVIYEETLRIERAEYMHSGDELSDCRNKDEREAMLDLLTRNTSAKLAAKRAERAQLESAKSALESTINTLKSAKETLNGIKTIILTEMENI